MGYNIILVLGIVVALGLALKILFNGIELALAGNAAVFFSAYLPVVMIFIATIIIIVVVYRRKK